MALGGISGICYAPSGKIRARALALFGVAFLTSLGGLVSASEPGRVPARLLAPILPGALDQDLFGEAVLMYSNAARRERGLPALAADRRLTRAAEDQASNMARLRTHSHILPVRGQSDFRARLHYERVAFRDAGENIAMGKLYRLLGRPISARMSGCSFTYGDTGAPVPIHTYASIAAEVVSRWLASPGHRASLLSPVFQRFGAGVGIDPAGPACGDLYMVQNFAD